MNATKILILEDHSLTQQVLLITLRSLGYNNLYVAENGESAFRLLHLHKHFDVLICDIQMPGIDGLTFLREARNVGSIEAVILFSEILSELRIAIQQLARLCNYQVLGDLTKPFSADALKMLLLRYCPSAPQPRQLVIEELPSATDVQQALLDGNFAPYFQPQLDLKSLRISGVEVSTRWQHPQLGELMYESFVDVVRHFGFLDELTIQITHQALQFLRQQQQSNTLSLSITLEAQQLSKPELIDRIRQVLEDADLLPHSLNIQLKEADFLQAPVSSLEHLVRLRLLGYGITIDNFGAGPSSFQRLCDIPYSQWKLDTNLVRTIPFNPRSPIVVSSLLRLASQLGTSAVADGIENQEQLSLIRQLNCPYGQGNFLSPALKAVDFATWLQQHELGNRASGADKHA